MKTCIIYSLVLSGLLASGGWARAEHDKSCKNVHGKVTVVAEDSITVNDQLYKVGKSTHITRNDQVVKLDKISPGDLVCLDPRGKDDIGGGEVASVAVLAASDSLPVREREYVREKETVISHDKNCNHLHGTVTRIDGSTVVVDDKPYACGTTTLVTKDGQTTTIETIKPGDFVCVDKANDKVASVVVLNPSEAAPFQSREIIREKIREEK
jgi:hypothetical protein